MCGLDRSNAVDKVPASLRKPEVALCERGWTQGVEDVAKCHVRALLVVEKRLIWSEQIIINR